MSEEAREGTGGRAAQGGCRLPTAAVAIMRLFLIAIVAVEASASARSRSSSLRECALR
jgi:hypothetical protein